jgi:hypothetical protein
MSKQATRRDTLKQARDRLRICRLGVRLLLGAPTSAVLGFAARHRRLRPAGGDPTDGVEPYPEKKYREPFSLAQLTHLGEALREADHQGLQVANLARADHRGAGVKNGTLATLESVTPDRFVARLDDGRRVAFGPAEYDHIAHGYAITIHKAQGATVDRTYVLADLMMNRNASYLALTRHRQGLQIYSDRETFDSREHLDRALSRAPSKDLARDYALAAIERHAARLEPLLQRAYDLGNERQEIRSSISAHDHADAMEQRLRAARATLEHTAARVYADPAQAVGRLTADPHAEARLEAGQAQAYGQLHGRPATLFLRPDTARERADQAVPGLQVTLSNHQRAEQVAAQARSIANSTGDSLPSLHDQLSQVNRTLHRLEQAMAGPEKALEAAVRELGTDGARHALAALPRALHLPVDLAIREVAKVLDLGLGLSLGR